MKKIILAILAIVLASGAFIAVGHAASTSNEVINYVYVDVKGEVNNPGVYRVSDSCRVFQVLELAGGLTNNSNTDNVNLAAKISDELVIRIPSSTTTSIDITSSLININTATIDELDALPGIGYSVAGKIVDYRMTNGNFKDIEDIKEVSGIGDVIYDQIKDLITIW